MTALGDAKKKGKKKSHKKKTTSTAAVESQTAEQKSTLFPKPDKKLIGSDISDDKSTSSTLGHAASTSLTTVGSTVSVGLTGSTTSVVLTGSTASVALTGSTTIVGSAEVAGLSRPTTLGLVGSTVPVNSTVTLKLVSSLTTTGKVQAGILQTGNESTVIQTTVNRNIAMTQQSNSSNMTANEEVVDMIDDDDEMESQGVPVEDSKSVELSFIHEFRQTSDEPNFSKYEQEDYDNFLTEPMPEFRRKKRHFRLPYADARKKRQVTIVPEYSINQNPFL